MATTAEPLTKPKKVPIIRSVMPNPVKRIIRTIIWLIRPPTIKVAKTIKTKDSVKRMPIIEILQQTPTILPIIIAYEPVWAIGQQDIPEILYLEKVFMWIAQHLTSQINQKFLLLYGGSVSEQSAQKLIKIRQLSGFLVGGASTHFDRFKNIIVATQS